MDLATDFDEGVVAGRIEEFLREQVDSYERDGAIVGMSGGLDSAVVAALLARALGPERVLAVFMPERDTNPQSKLHAMKEVERLGVRWQEFDITPILSALGIYKLVPLKLLGSRRVKESVVKWQHRAQREAFGEPPFARGLLGTRGMNKTKAGFFDSDSLTLVRTVVFRWCSVSLGGTGQSPTGHCQSRRSHSLGSG